MNRWKKTDVCISIRTTAEFKERFWNQADMESRSLSNLIIKLMEEYLESVEGGAER